MFWEKFLDLCNERNVKPNPVAKELNISSGSVTGWKNGVQPRDLQLKKIADYFGVPMSYFTEKEKPSAEGELLERNKDNQISPNEPKLTEGEELMLQLFRQIPEDKQQTVLETIRLVLKIQE